MKVNESKTIGMIKFLPALQYAFPEIKQAFYYIKGEEEFVRISYQYIDIRYDFDVCVTADSVSAMYTDVWREVIRRFG